MQCDLIVSRLTAILHCSCQHELLPLGVGKIMCVVPLVILACMHQTLFRMGENTMETFKMLEVAFGQQTLAITQVCERRIGC